MSKTNITKPIPLRASGLRVTIAGISILCLVLLWLGMWLEMRHERDLIIRAKMAENRNLAIVFEEHLVRSLSAASLTLSQVASEYGRLGNQFDIAGYAQSNRVENPPYAHLSVVDERGHVILQSLPSAVPGKSRDDEALRYHSQRQGKEIFIGKPRRSPAGDRWLFCLSRRLDKADGSFGGLAIIAIDSESFAAFYKRVDIGPNAVVSLIGMDGVVRARQLGGKFDAGADVGKSRVFVDQLPAAKAATFVGASPSDGVDKIFAYAAESGYPLVILVGSSYPAVLSAHQQRWGEYFGVAAGITLLGSLFLAIVMQQIAKRERSNRDLLQSEASRRESEARLRRISDAIPGAVYQYQLRADGQQSFLSVSDGIEDLTGYSSAAVLGDFSLLLDAVLPEDRERLSNATSRSAETLEPWQCEWRMRMVDGSVKWLRGHAVPEPRRADGSIVWNGLLTDVTERKAAEAERTRLAAIVESSGDAIVSRGLGLKILTWNAAAERMFGYQAEEIVGKSIDILIPPDKQAMVAQRRSSIDSGISCDPIDTVLLTQQGQRIDVSVSQSPMRDANGNLVSVSLCVRDISERKRGEAALRQSEQHLIVAQSIAHLGSWEWDFQSGRNTWSDENYRLFGYQPGAVEPNYDSWVNRIHPDDRSRVQEHLRSAFNGTTRCDIEFRVMHPNSEIRFVHWRGELFRDASGNELRMAGTVLDITERKKAEEAVRASERSIRRLYEITNTVNRSFDERMRDLLAFGCERFGVPNCSVNQARGEELEVRYSHSADGCLAEGMKIPRSAGYCRSVIEADEPICYEHIGQSDWREHPGYLALGMECYMGSKVMVDGAVYGTLCFVGAAPHRGQFTDADKDFLKLMAVWIGSEVERRDAHEQIRRSRDQIRQIIDTNPSFIFAKDCDGRFTLVNQAMADAFGTTVADLVGKTDADFDDHHAGVDFFRVKDLEVMDSLHEQFIAEETITDATGNVRWLQTVKRPILDETGRATQVLGVATDITARKHAEDALRGAHDELEARVAQRTAELTAASARLRASEERLQHALAVGHMGTWERDLRTGQINWDDRVYEMFGIAKDMAVSRELLHSHIFPADLLIIDDLQRRTVRGGQDYDYEVRFLRPDGKTIWVLTHAGLRRDANGTPTHIAGINFDITARKEAEEALHKLTEDLDRRVIVRTRELAESQARLRALVAKISKTEERERRRLAVELHDYLAQMLTVSRLSIARAGKLAVDDALKRRLAEAMESVDESIAYTRSLMAQLSPRVLYELGLPAALTWLAGQQQERHGLKVEIRGETEGFALDDEPSVLAYQIVRELLWNIVKHAQAHRAIVSYAIEHGELTVEVADDGEGFDPESLHANGNGVEKFGLFSIRERLELLAGKLEVTSQPGQGTRARFTLPARQSEITPMADQGAPPASAVPAARNRLNVMLVDDHAVVRRGMRQVLEEFTDLAVVGEAKDGVEGVELARQFRPDVVVMDVNMPGMNGIEATKLILQELPSTIVVGLSFDNGAEVARKMKAAGASACVTKERGAEEIHQAIIDAVAERRVVAD